jgi:predicted MFS family arabinose efflux permease
MQKPTEPPARNLSNRYRNYALFVLTLVFTSSHVDRQIIGILLEPIKTDLGASDTQMGFLVGLTFALFYATLGMPIAMLADRGNRRNIIAIAIATWSAMTVACGFATSFLQLALARIGVGIGEAGSNPPSHSLISDYFPIEKRSTAMAIFAVGVNLGLLFAYIGGGWMSQHLGWRTAFFVVGAPGLLIALLVRFTLIEPVRGASEKKPQTQTEPPAFMAVAKNMWQTRSLRHVVAAGSLAAFVGYGMVLWLPAYFVRSHGLTQTEVGFTLAFLFGILGGIGTFCSGVLADRLAVRDARWSLWVVAIALTTVVPLAVASFLVETTWIAIALFCFAAASI